MMIRSVYLESINESYIFRFSAKENYAMIYSVNFLF